MKRRPRLSLLNDQCCVCASDRSAHAGDFGIDPIWNGIVDGILEWHAQEARARRGMKQKSILRRLRYALKDRGFDNPIEAFVFFDTTGKGTLTSLEVR